MMATISGFDYDFVLNKRALSLLYYEAKYMYIYIYRLIYDVPNEKNILH